MCPQKCRWTGLEILDLTCEDVAAVSFVFLHTAFKAALNSDVQRNDSPVRDDTFIFWLQLWWRVRLMVKLPRIVLLHLKKEFGMPQRQWYNTWSSWSQLHVRSDTFSCWIPCEESCYWSQIQPPETKCSSRLPLSLYLFVVFICIYLFMHNKDLKGFLENILKLLHNNCKHAGILETHWI